MYVCVVMKLGTPAMGLWRVSVSTADFVRTREGTLSGDASIRQPFFFPSRAPKGKMTSSSKIKKRQNDDARTTMLRAHARTRSTLIMTQRDVWFFGVFDRCEINEPVRTRRCGQRVQRLAPCIGRLPNGSPLRVRFTVLNRWLSLPSSVCSSTKRLLRQ